MSKKDMFFYILIVVLVILFLWQWISKGAFEGMANQHISNLQKYNSQLQLLSGIGPLGSAHIHADVRVYINGQPIDFSQRKYQLASSFIHFEDGIGDVVHIHATGMAIGHLFRSLSMGINDNCIAAEKQNYCSDNGKKLKFYANGKPNNEFGNYEMHDLDKILVSYGNENDSEMQKQLSSITNLASGYSSQGGME